MAKVELHRLTGSKRARQLADLLDRLHRERRRVVVWVADEGRRQILDDYLWTFEKSAFVPHLLWGPELGEVEDPIVLVGEPANPNRASVLVVGDDLPSEDWAGTFDEVHDFIPAGDEGEQRSQVWKSWGGDVNSPG